MNTGETYNNIWPERRRIGLSPVARLFNTRAPSGRRVRREVADIEPRPRQFGFRKHGLRLGNHVGGRVLSAFGLKLQVSHQCRLAIVLKGTSTNKEALVVHGRGIPDRLLLAGKPSARMRETGYAALLGLG
jgi:hypothetical protein